MRLARIYPVHIATLLAVLALFISAQVANIRTTNDISNWTLGTFIANVFLVHQWSLTAQLSWNYPAWSISCEWLAYLAFPLIARIPAARFPKALNAFLGLSFMIALAVSYQLSAGHYLLRIVCGFTAGCLVYHLYQRSAIPNRGSLIGLVAGSLAALAILVETGPRISPYWGVVAFPLLIYAMSLDCGILRRLLGSRFAVFWGRASYSLYMTHALSAMLLGKTLPLGRFSGTPLILRLTVTAVWICSFGFTAVMTYRLIERPARDRLRARLHVPSVPTGGTLTS